MWTYFELVGDLQFRRGDPQSVVNKNHSEDGDEDGKVTNDGAHLEGDTHTLASDRRQKSGSSDSSSVSNSMSELSGPSRSHDYRLDSLRFHQQVCV